MKTKVRCTNFISRSWGMTTGFLIMLLMLFTPKVEASHLSGGAITIQHLSGNTYTMEARIYRDCRGVNLGSTALLRSSSSCGGNFSLSRVAVNDITPTCPGQVSYCQSRGGLPYGYEEHVYRGNRTINPQGGSASCTYTYNLCCRNGAITTLNNSSSNTFEIRTIFNPNLSPRNSTPEFLNPPVAIICAGQPATISPNASDANGDALVYSLTNCLQTGGGSVTYGAGFSATNPLSTTSGFNLNTSTGLLSFTPSGVQVGVVCTKVEEFRAGTKIGEINRDIQINVISCNNNNPVIATIPNQIAQVGQQLCVNVSATDVDNDNIALTATSAVGSFTVTGSSAGSATGTFCFTPTLSQQGQTFTVSINAQDDACPSPGTGVEAFNITVPAVQCNLTVNATAVDASCNQSDGSASATQSGGVNPISYNWSNGGSGSSISGLAAGTYTVTVVDGYNCVATASVTVGGGSTNIAATTTTSNPQCPNTNDGSITVNTTGGVAPITFSLNGGPAQTSNTFSGLGVGNYTITVTDNSGCPGISVSATLSASDNTNPVISCPANITRNNDRGQCSARVSYSVSASDNCPGSVTVTRTAGPASGSAFGLGTTTVSHTATDAFGNTASCSFTVTVVDAEAPVISCPANSTVNTDPGICGAAVSYNVTATDNCPGVTTSRVSGPASGATFPVGSTTVTYTAVDAAGNDAVCSFRVVVVDNEAPAISCPANISVGTDAGNCSAVVNYNVTSSDNCGSTVSQTGGQASGSAFSVGTTTNSFVATDAAGNTSGCSFTVTVSDNEDPVISCPANISVNTDAGNCSAVVSYSVTSSDNCGSTVAQNGGQASGSAFPVGSTTNSFTATDAAGNTASCSFTVTVSDNEDPVISCPANISVNNDAGNCSAVVSYNVSSSDNCGSTVAQTGGQASGSAFPVGTTTNSFTATDAAGNTASCSFTVTVSDNEAPTITCPSNISVNTDAGQCSALVAFRVNSSDNCPGQTVAQTAGQASGSAFPKGTTTNSFVVTDAAGNTANCSFTVTVSDNEAPVISCPANISVSTDPGNCTAVVNYNVTSSDNCPGETIAQTGGNASGFAFPKGTTTNSFEVTDASGNTANCSFTVTVSDNEAPVITCPSNISVNNDAGNCSAVVTYTVTSSDNCPGQVVTQTGGQASGTAFAVGTTTNSFLVTDASGNTANCSFDITVTDNEAPNALCQNVTVQLDAQGNGSTTASAVNNGSTDNCQVAGISLSQTSFNCSNVGPNAVVLTVTDIYGNTSTCGATVTVEDNVDPVARCQNVTVQLDNNGQGSTTAQAVDNGSSDACGIASLVLSQTAFNCSNLGANPVVLTVTDVNGNSSTCNATVTVEDNIAPSITCPAAVSLECLRDVPAANTSLVSASDNCTVVAINHVGDVDNGATGCAGDPFVVTRTYIAIDQSGNSTTCTQTITVESTPVVVSTSSNPGPYVFPAYQDSSCTTLNSAAMGGCPPYTIQWSTGATTSSINVCPTVNTTYYVTYTDAEGCSGIDSIKVCVIDISCVGGDNNGLNGNGQGGQGQNNSPNAQPHISMCHIPPGNPANAMTKCLPIPAVQAHMQQVHGGDHLGACGTVVSRSCNFGNNAKLGQPSAGAEMDSQLESRFEAFPNPFNTATTVRFTLGYDADVNLRVYGMDGTMVSDLFTGAVKQGVENSVEFAPSGITNGIYFARLVTSTGEVLTYKLILTK